MKCVFNENHPVDALADPENRIALLTTNMLMKGLLRENYRYGVSSVFVSDENIATIRIGYVIKTPFKDIISLKLSQLQEAGIFLKINSLYMQDFEMKPEAIGPQVLTIQHLGTGFVVIFSLLALSVAVFAVEIAPKLWKKLLSWLEKVVFCCVVVKFTGMNKMM
jgi:hypothetical protein